MFSSTVNVDEHGKKGSDPDAEKAGPEFRC
jgi:hypothetical protein